jgi:dihydroxyacetone kinase-like protein
MEGVVARGKAEAGDKTMLDALAPALDTLDTSLASGASIGDALQAASTAADEGRDATIPMLARKGRASYLGERSVGHQDPGATSAALLIAAAAEAFSGLAP